jgi:hypothetical protein
MHGRFGNRAMAPLESFLHDPITTDDEFNSLLKELVCPDNVGSVHEAARESAAPVAQLTAPKHAFYDEKGVARHSHAFRSSNISGPEILAQQAVATECESIETASSPPHDGCLLENRLEKARERNFRNQRACRERLRVRCCMLSAQFM